MQHSPVHKEDWRSLVIRLGNRTSYYASHFNLQLRGLHSPLLFSSPLRCLLSLLSSSLPFFPLVPSLLGSCALCISLLLRASPFHLVLLFSALVSVLSYHLLSLSLLFSTLSFSLVFCPPLLYPLLFSCLHSSSLIYSHILLTRWMNHPSSFKCGHFCSVWGMTRLLAKYDHLNYLEWIKNWITVMFDLNKIMYLQKVVVVL